MPILRGVADVITRRILQVGESFAQASHRLHGLVHRQRRLRQPYDAIGILNLERIHGPRSVNEGDTIGSLAGCTLDLLVSGVTNEQDLVVVACESHGLAVDFGDQRTRGIDGLQTALFGGNHNRGRDTVRTEDEACSLRRLAHLVNENCTTLFKFGNHVNVVHNLFANVDRGSKRFERSFHGNDGPIYTCAVSARRCQQDALGFAHSDESTAVGRLGYPCTMTDDQSTAESPWSVATLTGKLKAYIDRLGLVWVEGEITQISHGKMGRFGTLRDLTEETAMGFSIWASAYANVPESLKAGDRVIALAKVDFWKKNGDLKLVVQHMRHVGLGDLLEKLERLRAQLAAEGLFSADRKKPLPFLPRRVGLITGADSDAEKDVLKNARLRWPSVDFEIRHTPVQGPDTAPRVIAALTELNAIDDVDVIIIARGGGDFLNLLPFSDESLIRAVAACETPVISAIGHEADRPLLDEVADLRASTPTDAGKRVVPDLAEESALIADARGRMLNHITTLMSNEQVRLDQMRSRPVLASPAWITEQRAEDILRHVQRGHGLVMHALDVASAEISGLRGHLRSLSPQQTLDRGYAIAVTATKRLIRHTSDAPAGTEVILTLADGKIGATSTGPAT